MQQHIIEHILRNKTTLISPSMEIVGLYRRMDLQNYYFNNRKIDAVFVFLGQYPYIPSS